MTGRCTGQKNGFTLIEILSAVAILMIIVLVMGRIFGDSARMWQIGTKNVQSDTEGRIVMDMLERQISQSIADEVLTFRTFGLPEYGVAVYGVAPEMGVEIFFVAPERTPSASMRRSAQLAGYYMDEMLDENGNVIPNRYRLVRVRRTASSYTNPNNSAYLRSDWWMQMFGPERETIVENVAAFEVWAYSEDRNDYVADYSSADEGNKLPLWLDIYLELLGEDDAVRVAELMNRNQDEAAMRIINENSRRYVTRVFFPMREGYGPRAQ